MHAIDGVEMPREEDSGNIVRDPQSRVIRSDQGVRFHAGWRFLPDDLRLTLPPWLLGPREPDLSVDVVRGRDLVALSVDFFGAKLVPTDGGPPNVERKGAGTHVMVVTFPFQHAHEEAQYVTDDGSALFPNPSKPDDPIKLPTMPGAPPGSLSSSTPPSLPVEFRPARASRLVFAIGPSDSIEFTRAGILRAMRELTPVLHPNAEPPGERGSIGTTTDRPLRFIWVGPNLVARYTGAQILLGRPTAEDRRTQPAPDAATPRGALAFAQNLRAVRVDASATALIAGPDLGQRAELPDALAAVIVRRPDIFIPRAKYSTSPTQEQTAIEAPYRLIISPSSDGRWVHADAPVPGRDSERHVELWHSRLTVAGIEGPAEDARRRIVRAVWTRDRDGLSAAEWRGDDGANGHPLSVPTNEIEDYPFRGSLNRADRHRLVRQTSEQWPGIKDPRSVRPVGVDKLWLSGLGAWLDLHGSWYTKEYSLHEPQGYPSVLAWDHIAPMGRDQWVRVVYPGYLYPLGHPAALVKITERRVTQKPAVASLYQIKFLVVSEPSRDYAASDWPFVRVDLTPTTTPLLADPDTDPDTAHGSGTFFWPQLGDGSFFEFTLDAWDKDGRKHGLRAPLLWVAEHYSTPTSVDAYYDADSKRVIPALGQKIAYTPRSAAGDSITETQQLRFRGRATRGGSTPFLSSADVVMDAARRLSDVGPMTIVYNDAYLAHGLGETATAENKGQLWANILLTETRTARQQALDANNPALPSVSFGTAKAGSDRAGGFVTPDLPIRGISTLTGAVGDIANMETLDFKPEKFFEGTFPKLFGLVDLWDLLQEVTDVARMPNLVSEAVESVTKLVDDISDLLAALQTVADGGFADASTAAAGALATIQGHATTIRDLLDPGSALSVDDRIAGLSAEFTAIAAALGSVPASHPLVPPVVRKTLEALTKAIGTAVTTMDVLAELTRLLKTFEPGTLEMSFRYEFTPRLFTAWPGSDFTLIELPEDGFSLSVEGRASGTGEVSARAMAEIRGLTLHLFGKEDQDAAPLVRIPFENISFIAGSDGKSEVDVNLGEITFLGVLSFVEVLKEFIPLDGFSDPPFLEVDPSGLKAGFTLPIPSVSVGVFNLSNISLGADVQVPFLGEALSFGFQFCSRERPFNLSVMCIGGGGWFAIRLNPKGLQVLELGLEAGVMLAVDFGVASGSISATVGIYMRLETDKGSLTGYFRLRGEVDVLGLISASIELYLELTYHFDSGKMIGTARLTIEVSVLCFSGSVTIECTRQFAGSKGDPSLRDQLLEPDDTAPAWDEYWRAFALEEA